MKLVRCLTAAIPVLALSLGSPALVADDKAPAAAPAKDAKPKAAHKAAKMPSKDEMMKAWMEVATPGEAHKKLEPIVGSFTSKVKAWMDPSSKEPEMSEGTDESTWVLGGRFVEEHHEGKMMGQPFSGIGHTGYDNYKKKYVGVWMDNMGTMIMTMTGSFDKDGKVMTSWSTMDDPIMKKPTKVKSVLTIADNDHHKFEMWMAGPDGKMFKTLEIEYERKK